MDVQRMVEFLTGIADDMEDTLAGDAGELNPTENPVWLQRGAANIAWLRGEIKELADSIVPDAVMSRRTLQGVAKDLGVRSDWHEPDEQDVTAELVGGGSFDNAMLPATDSMEMCVLLRQGGMPVAVVNLASLFAMACGEDF